MARHRGCACRALVRTGDPQAGQLACSIVACGDIPVALAARALRLFRGDGDPRHGASRHGLRLVVGADGRRAGADDGRRDGTDPQRPCPRLGQAQARQAFVRTSLRLSRRMAALYRDARPRRARSPAAERAYCPRLRRHRRRPRRPAAGQRRRSRHLRRHRQRLARRLPRRRGLRQCRQFLERDRGERPNPRARSPARRLGKR